VRRSGEKLFFDSDSCAARIVTMFDASGSKLGGMPSSCSVWRRTIGRESNAAAVGRSC